MKMSILFDMDKIKDVLIKSNNVLLMLKDLYYNYSTSVISDQDYDFFEKHIELLAEKSKIDITNDVKYNALKIVGIPSDFNTNYDVNEYFNDALIAWKAIEKLLYYWNSRYMEQIKLEMANLIRKHNPDMTLDEINDVIERDGLGEK